MAHGALPDLLDQLASRAPFKLLLNVLDITPVPAFGCDSQHSCALLQCSFEHEQRSQNIVVDPALFRSDSRLTAVSAACTPRREARQWATPALDHNLADNTQPHYIGCKYSAKQDLHIIGAPKCVNRLLVQA
jgi:hypothetical protein